MGERIRCVYLEQTDFYRRYLRRYCSGNPGCSDGRSYHNAQVLLDEIEVRPEDRDKHASGDSWDHEDPRWPVKCDHCDHFFSPQNQWQLFYVNLFRHPDTKELLPLEDAPIGAMWNAWWMPDEYLVDGQYLICRVPGKHDWSIDSQARNCDQKDRPHRCWCRHGTPPNITVDKNCDTCGAGAGSILISGGWHGFLRNGYLEEC